MYILSNTYAIRALMTLVEESREGIIGEFEDELAEGWYFWIDEQITDRQWSEQLHAYLLKEEIE